MTILKNTSSVLDELFNQLPATFTREIQNEHNHVAVNIHETVTAFHLELIAPGRSKNDFSIQIEKGLLTINYENKEQSKEKNYKTIRREYSFKNFKRSFGLDEKINTEGILANYEDGILKLLLPKKEEITITPKQIAIN